MTSGIVTGGHYSRTLERANLSPEYQDSGFEQHFAGNLDAPTHLPAGSVTKYYSFGHPFRVIMTTERP